MNACRNKQPEIVNYDVNKSTEGTSNKLPFNSHVTIDKRTLSNYMRLRALEQKYTSTSCENDFKDFGVKEIGNKPPNLPWNETTRTKMESAVTNLENLIMNSKPDVTSLAPSSRLTEDLQKEIDHIKSAKSVGFKHEKDMLERRIAHYQSQCKIQSKRYGTVVNHNVKKTARDLLKAFQLLHSSLQSALSSNDSAHTSQICPSSNFIQPRLEIKSEPNSSFESNSNFNKFQYSRSRTFLCLQQIEFNEFYHTQKALLDTLAKYCKLLRKQGEVNSVFSNVGESETQSALHSSQSFVSSNSNTECDEIVPPCENCDDNLTDIDCVVKQKQCQLKDLNSIYGQLLDRRIRQSVASTALQQSLSRVNKDLKALSSEKPGGNGETSSNIINLPSTLQLRSDVIQMNDRVNKLKEDLKPKLDHVRDLTKTISVTCNNTHETTAAENRRNKLQYLVEQQNRVISYLNNAQERNEKVMRSLEEEKVTSVDNQVQRVHIINSEIQKMQEFSKNIQEDLNKLQLSGRKRHRITISHNDKFAYQLYKILDQKNHLDKGKLLEKQHKEVKQEFQELFEDGKVKQENLENCDPRLLERNASCEVNLKRSKLWRHNTSLSDNVLTYEHIIETVRHVVEDECEQKARLSCCFLKYRKQLQHLEESLSECECSVSNTTSKYLEKETSVATLNKDLNRVELQLSAQMQAWSNLQSKISSNPCEQLERDAFVEFFLHPNRASVNISRWKNARFTS